MRRVHPSASHRHTGRSLRALALSALLVLFSASAARAEWVVDAFFGIPFPRGGETEADRVAADYFISDADVDVDLNFGLRFGRYAQLTDWMDLGVMLDTSGMLGELGAVDFNFVPITGLLAARFPILKSDELPHGLLQPYIGVGPSVVWSELRENVFEDTAVSGGAQGVAGVKFMLFENFGIFAEYRFQYFEADYADEVLPTNERGHVKVRSLTHTPTIGISAHFDLPW